MSNVSHPYYPINLVIPHYVPNNKSMVEILAIFATLSASACVVTFVYSGTKSHLIKRRWTRMKISWFVASGLIHMIVEGYFSIFHRTIAGHQSYIAQIWKEYGKGDSRYITSDTFTVCMETITSFVDGPLALLACYAFIVNKPYRYVVQLVLSLCQLYGDVLYYMTEIKDGFIHGELYHPVYFWGYFFFLNFIWIVIPSICISESFLQLCKAQLKIDEMPSKKSKKNK